MKKVTHSPGSANVLLKGLSLMMFLSLSAIGIAFGQTVTCPPNLDFEKGDYSGWHYEVGYSGQGTVANGVTFGNNNPAGQAGNGLGFPLTLPTTNPNNPPWSAGGTRPAGPTPATDPVTFTSTASVARFDTTSASVSPNDTDYYGGFKINPAGGGSYAMQIGDDTPQYAAERMFYYVHVPVGFKDYSFNFRFACVIYDGGHSRDQQPAFRIQAYDSADATKSPLPCAFTNYIAGDPALLATYGFKTYAKNTSISYLPWTGAALPLSGQGGKTIVVEVSALGCTQSGHWAYGYFDVISCGKYKAAVSYCNLDSGKVRFVGTGASTPYKWYDQSWNYLGLGSYIDVAIPNTPSVFYGVLPTASAGCIDTIVTDTVSNFLINTTPKTPCVQFGKTIQFNTSVIGGLPSKYTYRWNANSELSCDTCNNPVASPVDTTSYYVTVTDRVGCFRRDTVHVFQAPNAGPDLKVCPWGERPAQLHVAGPPNASFHWYDFGTSNPGQYLSCTDCVNPTSAPVPSSYTYTVGYDGCPVLDTLIVYHDTSNYIVTPQDLMIVCRPDYRNLLSQAYGPFPKANIACGTNSPITCLPADEVTATIGIVGTPPKAAKNTPFLTANRFIKYQFIIKKQDILYSGLYSGTLNSMAFSTLRNTVLSSVPIEFITLSLGCIDQTDFPTPTNNNSFFGSTALTQVAALGSYNITANSWNNIKFDNPYSWDTSKNLLVDFCIGPITTPDPNGTDPVSMEEGVSIQKFSDAINVCGGNVPVVYKYLQRPTVQFNYCPTPDLPFQYTWRPGNNLDDSTRQNPTAYIPRSIDYAVFSVGRNGCSIRDSLHIVVPDHHLNAGPVDTFICQGQPAFLFSSGGQGYKWFEVQEGLFTDASGSLNCTDCQFPTATPMQTTTYAVVFTNEVGMGNPANAEYITGCPDTMFLTVHVWPLPNVHILNADTTITIGQSVPLYVQGAQHYSWSPSGSLSDPNAAMTVATPTATTTYIATGFDVHSCPYNDSVKITVNYHTNLLVPTGFTPNGDGVNDIFRIVNANVQRLMEFRVFNRWGQEIFSTTDIRKGWDGTWKGVKQEVGTYGYIIRVGYADQTVEMYKGDVQLIR